ncbi:MAG: alcohol dehydrogenase [Chaenotheca gracillima]|nr:MAG: alcohol dehydrogenase [Chaenotheca gracillima]
MAAAVVLPIIDLIMGLIGNWFSGTSTVMLRGRKVNIHWLFFSDREAIKGCCARRKKNGSPDMGPTVGRIDDEMARIGVPAADRAKVCVMLYDVVANGTSTILDQYTPSRGPTGNEPAAIVSMNDGNSTLRPHFHMTVGPFIGRIDQELTSIGVSLPYRAKICSILHEVATNGRSAILHGDCVDVSSPHHDEEIVGSTNDGVGPIEIEPLGSDGAA